MSSIQIVRQSNNDQVTIVASCVTLFEAIKAAESLAASGVNIRIIDPFTIKPIDVATIIASAQQTGGRIITAEDHYAEGLNFFFLCFPFFVLILHYP